MKVKLIFSTGKVTEYENVSEIKINAKYEHSKVEEIMGRLFMNPLKLKKRRIKTWKQINHRTEP